MSIRRFKTPRYSDEKIASLNKNHHDNFLKFDRSIRECVNIQNPLFRIRALQNIYTDIKEQSDEIDKHLPHITSNNSFSLTTSEEEYLKDLQHFKTYRYLDNLRDLRDQNYEKNKNALISIFERNIQIQLYNAKIKNTFDGTFYVYQNIEGKETNTRQSFLHYFMGVPRKGQSAFFYFLDWLSYIAGGFFIIPLKNTLKLVTEFLPNKFTVIFEDELDGFMGGSDLEFYKGVHVYTFFIPILFGISKLLHIVGRAITSPLTSAKIGFEYGKELASSLDIGDSATKVLGTILGSLLALPSLAIGLTAVVLTIFFFPPSLIWLVGKLPVVGIEAAAWLTSMGQTLGALKGVSGFAETALQFTTQIAPAIASKAAAGITAFSQFIMFAQKFLRLFDIFRPKEKPNTTSQAPSPQEMVDIPPSSYHTLQARGLPIKKEPKNTNQFEASFTSSLWANNPNFNRQIKLIADMDASKGNLKPQ